MNTRIDRIALYSKIVLTIAILCFSIGVVTATPQKDYTFYGTATLNGEVLTAQDNDVVSLEVDGVELVSYTMGDMDTAADKYVLKVPMDTNSSVTTAAQEGDTAYIYINGIAINEGTQVIGEPANTVQLDISATSINKPPSATVLHPNGGESIPLGTQVQVSAHATDDTAVTSVTFSYSSNGGSDWNSIGAGTRVSGTDKDGIWNRTWNTNELGAGSNYLIKAVADDGTSTRENQSDSTFSLTCTPPSAPALNDPGTTDTDGSYTVSWSSVSGATSYTLEEDTSSSFGSPTIVYSGSGTSTQITDRADGTYYYRVKACNACGCSGWSNVEDIEVSMDVGGWNKTFGGTDDDVAYSVQQTSDGGFILAGYTNSYGAGSSDFWLVKTDSSGNKQWDKTFGATESDIARSVQETSDGGYILAGCTRSYGAGSYDAWLVRINSNGDILWHAALGGTGWDMAESVQQTSDGGFIFTGYTGSYGDVFYDAWLVKVDCNGCVQWNTTFGGFGRDVAESVQQTSDGGYIIAGSTPPQGSYLFAAGSMNPLGIDFADVWLVKTDSNGNKQWDKTFGGADWDAAESVQQTADGGFILAGYTKSYGDGDSDFWLIKTDSDGGKEWDKTFGGTDDDYAYSVWQTFDGGYTLAGVTEPPSDPTPVILAGFMGPCSAGGSDVWLIKTDSEGGKEWDKTFGGTDNDYASSVQQTSDGGYVLAGSTKSYGAGGSDFWLVKVGGAGVPVPPTPTLNDPGTTDTDGSYTVAWSSVSGATSYTLEEDTSGSFGSPTVVYSGSGTSKYITGRSNGAYYYRVKACNACGCSGWSNVEDIEVTVEGLPKTGDLNDDGILTPADAAITLQLAASRGWHLAADVNGDGSVTSLDALMILMMAQKTQVCVNASEVVSGAFDVTIDIHNVVDLDSGQFDLTFDSSVVNVIGVNAGNIGGTPIPIDGWCFMDADTIRIVFNFGAVDGVSGSGYVAKIDFERTGSQGDTSILDISEGVLVDTCANEIPAIWIDGEVTIGEPTPTSTAPDLVVESITTNCGYLFGNESNEVSATIVNNGGDCGNSFNVSFVLSGGFSAVESVDALASGNSTMVSVVDPTISNAGDSVTITVIADCDGEIAEDDESNNAAVQTETVANNGYKGKTYTGGGKMPTWKTFDLNGDLVYSAGDSYYLSMGNDRHWATYDVCWAAGDLPVPATATVAEARLYALYTWDKASVMPDEVSMSFNGVVQTRDAHYSDEKMHGTSYNYPYGMLAYNITDNFNAGGNIANLTNSHSGGGNVSMRGMMLLVVYEDGNEPRRQIFLNEEFDLLCGKSSKCTTSEEATAWAPITGLAIDPSIVASARLITFAPGAGPNEGELIFNGHIWTDEWNDNGLHQIGISDRAVTRYFKSTDNEVGFRSSDDYMEASNAILVLEEGDRDP